VFVDSVRILWADGFSFLLLAVLAYLPLFVLHLHLAGDRVGVEAAATAFSLPVPKTRFGDVLDAWAACATVSTMLGSLLPLLLQGAVAYGVFRTLLGRPVPLGASIARGLKRSLAVLSTAISVLLVVASWPRGSPWLVGVVHPALEFLPRFAAFLGVVLFQVTLYVAVPAVTVEDRTGFGRAFLRSLTLTRGSWLEIYRIWLVLALVWWGIHIGLVPWAFGRAGTLWVTRGVLLVHDLALALLAVFQAVTAAVVYTTLWTAKEGVGDQEIARVFD